MRLRRTPLAAAFSAGLAGTLVVVSAWPAAAASTIGGGANNIVRVATSTGHETEQRASVRVTPYGGPYLNTTNVAIATATDCTGCRSVAVAFQAVFAGGDLRVASPGNAAVATTAACVDCVSFAYAFQYVVSTPRPAHLTPAGRAEVNAIADRIDSVAASGAAPDVLCTELAALAHELVDAIVAPGSVDLAGGGPLTLEPPDLVAPDC